MECLLAKTNSKKTPVKSAKKAPAKKTTSKKKAAKKAAATKTKKTAAKKTTTKKKAGTKKTTAKKTSVKKAAKPSAVTKKVTKKKAAKKKITKKKAAVKKTAVKKKAAAKKTPMKKAASSAKPAKPSAPTKPEDMTIEQAMGLEWTLAKLRRVKSGLTRKDLAEYRALLLEKRKEIVGDVKGMESARSASLDDLAHMPLHMADVGTDAFEQEFMLGLIESERRLLGEITEALHRIEDKTYGVCMASGRPIGKARLEFKPWAKYCIEVARLREKRGL